MQTSSPTQGCMLQSFTLNRSACISSGQVPCARVGTSMWRNLLVKPPLQACVHGDHSVQGCKVQSRSQLPVWQFWVSVFVSHGSPPFLGFTTRWRSRSLVPPPHSAVHSLKSDHPDILQSTGHLSWLQTRVYTNFGHIMPFSLGAVMISRVSVCTPPHCSIPPPGSFLVPSRSHKSSHGTGCPSLLHSPD